MKSFKIKTKSIKSNGFKPSLRKFTQKSLKLQKNFTNAKKFSLKKSTSSLKINKSIFKMNKNININKNINDKSSFLRWFSSNFPEHIEIRMPALSPTADVDTASIAEWVANEGDEISTGDLLLNVQTDKSVVGYDSTEDGYLAKILVDVDAGQDIKLDKLIGIIVEEEADIDAFKNAKLSDFDNESGEGSVASVETPVETETATASTNNVETQQFTQTSSSGQRIIASPLAKVTAAEKGFNLGDIKGTGPEGRIIQADVLEFKGTPAKQTTTTTQQAALPLTDGGFVDIPHTQMRKTIARRLTQSKTTIPHYYLTVECTMDKVLELRKKLNDRVDDATKKISVNDFVIKASALALQKVPQVNSSWMDDAIRQYDYVDISIAVATESGLITPIVKDADCKGLLNISSDVKQLATKAKENKLLPEEFTGGTFTVSNLGMFGVTNFSAIINPPQACILAVGGTSDKVVKTNDETDPFKVTKVMNVTMSCDHRVVDGAVGATWLKEFKSLMEEPTNMLL